jgi:hypothetical protein
VWQTTPAQAVSARGYGHPERVQDELGFQVVAHRPAHDPPRVDVLHRGQEQEPLPGLDVFQVAHPQLIRCLPRELAVDQVRRRWLRRLADSGAQPAATTVRTAQPGRSHQPGDPLLADPNAMIVAQVKQDPRRAIRLVGLRVDLADPCQKRRVLDASLTRRSPLPGVEALPGHPDRLAQQGDRKLCSLRLDEPKPHLGPSVSLAKKPQPASRSPAPAAAPDSPAPTRATAAAHRS